MKIYYKNFHIFEKKKLFIIKQSLGTLTLNNNVSIFDNLFKFQRGQIDCFPVSYLTYLMHKEVNDKKKSCNNTGKK